MNDEHNTSLQWLQQRIEQARTDAGKLPSLSPERSAAWRQIAEMERVAKQLAKRTVGVKEYNPFEDE